ncbi:MAG: hypothetical protein DMG56_23420, partial [Acidobacteria bacterium]
MATPFPENPEGESLIFLFLDYEKIHLAQVPAGLPFTPRGIPMKISHLAPLLPLVASGALAVSNPSPAKPAPDPRELQVLNASPFHSMVVYVSDFELDVLHVREPRRAVSRNSPSVISGVASSVPRATQKNAPSGSSLNKRAPVPAADSQAEETAAEQADRLVNIMAEDLVTALGKAGYKVSRLRTGQVLPAAGLRIHGVFAEADERNRVRRLLVGSNPITPKMLLYVGVNNLARPQQPLYELANPPSDDGRHGPVITVTSYSPAARFEMDRNAADDDFKKIAS